jgi:hypothetical protein
MNHRFNCRILLIRLFFPLAYAGFFAVQFFINFDTTLSGSRDRYQVIKCRVQTNIPVALQKANNDHPVKTKFRLNKRFQPAVVPSLPDISGCPVIRDITVLHLTYIGPFVADPLLNIRSLRGPPFHTLSS